MRPSAVQWLSRPLGKPLPALSQLGEAQFRLTFRTAFAFLPPSSPSMIMAAYTGPLFTLRLAVPSQRRSSPAREHPSPPGSLERFALTNASKPPADSDCQAEERTLSKGAEKRPYEASIAFLLPSKVAPLAVHRNRIRRRWLEAARLAAVHGAAVSNEDGMERLSFAEPQGPRSWFVPRARYMVFPRLECLRVPTPELLSEVAKALKATKTQAEERLYMRTLETAVSAVEAQMAQEPETEMEGLR